ncbi:hypothetical protein [Aquisphaera insulae]|uniref:hypothetical protein n=1 Tax=Aquisphaera insulae TaxID=2712864 RepID=UPI0013EAD0C9|nr:hypothetical protein [Aquisphaera insulae]
MLRNLRERGPRFGLSYPRLFDPGHVVEETARWRINGFKVRLLIWSADEWDLLAERPADAQLHPTGVWCALRYD